MSTSSGLSMAQAASLSGFPEWLPSESLAEQRVVDTLGGLHAIAQALESR